MHFEKIFNLYQSFLARRRSHTMSHCASIDVGCNTISHVLSKGIPTNTHKQERFCVTKKYRNLDITVDYKIIGKATKKISIFPPSILDTCLSISLFPIDFPNKFTLSKGGTHHYLEFKFEY